MTLARAHNRNTVPLTPPVVTSKPQFQNTFSAIAILFPICYLSLVLKHLIRYERNCLRKASEAHLTHKAKTIELLGVNKRDEL